MNIKKITAIFIAVVITSIVFSSPISADTTDLETSIVSAKQYIEENITNAETFQDTISFAEANLITEITQIYSVEPDTENPQTLAEYILLRRTFGQSITVSEDSAEDYGDILASSQQDDGSFGNIKATIYSLAALKSVGKEAGTYGDNTFDDIAAVNYLVANQSENGEIGNLETSADAAAVLWQYKDSEETNSALNKLISYLESFSDSDDTLELSLALMGLTDANYGQTTEAMQKIIDKLLSRQNNDGGFPSSEEGASEADATKAAFRALEAVRYTVTPFNALINGIQFSSSGLDFSQMYPLLIAYAVLVVCSIGLWIFIFKRKPRSKTLEESKKESEEKFSNVKTFSESEEGENEKDNDTKVRANDTEDSDKRKE
ncbi:MAG: terpene cyclase/mutase family protein [Clostridiales bacterium]|nr:terpene cyclase/mutase family protein [Clostridiales bacterium]